MTLQIHKASRQLPGKTNRAPPSAPASRPTWDHGEERKERAAPKPVWRKSDAFPGFMFLQRLYDANETTQIIGNGLLSQLGLYIYTNLTLLAFSFRLFAFSRSTDPAPELLLAHELGARQTWPLSCQGISGLSSMTRGFPLSLGIVPWSTPPGGFRRETNRTLRKKTETKKTQRNRATGHLDLV